MKRLHLDFETRSPVDLRLEGLWKYVSNPHTEITCMTWALDDEKPILMKRGDTDYNKTPLCGDYDLEIVAHNAHFEYGIYYYILHKRFGWPALNDPMDWNCTMARAYMCGLPGSLDGLGKALQLPFKKYLEGKAAMLRTCSPLVDKQNNQIWKNGKPVYNEDPADYEKLYAYNILDVETERAGDKALPDLLPQERKVWALDLEINMRGIAVDYETSRKAMKLADDLKTGMNARLYKLTNNWVDAATRRECMLRYLEAMGVKGVDALNKETIPDILVREDVPQVVKDVLRIRNQVVKTSTAKYKKIVETVGDDGRVRGSLQYHAAHPGRWGGRAMQPHNFPKGFMGKGADERQADAIHAIQTMYDSPNMFLMTYGDESMNTISDALRGMIIAPAGKMIMAADYNAIEARCLFWQADDQEALGIYHRGESPYIGMACDIYGNPDIGKFTHPKEYDMGKRAVLGCFAKDTQVLTDRGWVPIIEVGKTDRLWDGEEWVNHEGVIYQGKKSVTHLAGITVTPGHLFLTPENKWVSASQVLQEKTDFLKSMTDMVNSALPGTKSGQEGVSAICGSGARVKVKHASSSATSLGARLLDVIGARRLKPTTTGRTGGGTQLSYQTHPTAYAYLTAYRQLFKDATTQILKFTTTTGGVVFSFLNLGSVIGSCFSSTSYHYLGGTTPLLRWTVSTSTGGTNQKTSDSSQGQETSETSDLCRPCKKNSQRSDRKCRVYDVLYAGPRNRFTILTDAGPLIAHNCGYQMGEDRFQETVKKEAQKHITIEFAKKVKDAYRTKYPKIVQFWKDAQTAAANAIRNPGRTFPVGKCVWGMTPGNRFLVCRLPSGRYLWYYRPTLKPGVTPWGTPTEEIRYRGFDSETGRFISQYTYGGKLVENMTQAIARDILVNGMMNANRDGYPIILTVHDEVAAEVLEAEATEANLEKFIKTLCDLPDWADGCPIAAEGFITRRYKK